MFVTAANASADASCTAVMLDSQAVETDRLQVNFSVNATVTDAAVISDGTREALDGGDSGHRTCTERCGGPLSVMCFYWNGCNAELGKALLYIALIIGAGVLTPHCFRALPLFRLIP